MVNTESRPNLDFTPKSVEQDKLSVRFRKFRNKAAGYTNLYDLFTSLGLDKGEDRYVFYISLAMKLLQIEMYDTRYLANHPVTEAGRKMRVIGKVFSVYDRQLEQDEAVLKYAQGRYNFFTSTVYKDSLRPRIIELAVNNLVAYGTSKKIHKIRSSFDPDSKMLESWGEKWKGELESLRQQEVATL